MLATDQKRPFIRFESMPKLNRTASEEAGHQVYDTVNYVFVIQHGSKDEFVKEAEEWLAQKKREAGQGNYPPEWVVQFREHYEEYKKGNEMPDEGTPLKMWPLLTPGQVKTFAAMYPPIKSVEELASVPDSGLQTLGLDGRVMRDKARAWIDSSKSAGRVAEEVASLKELNRQQETAIEAMNKRIQEMEAALPKAKRPKQQLEEADA